MRHFFPGLIVGLLFGAGLTLSGMVNPARVLGFLDIAGAWDPTLAVVLVAALIPSSISYAVVRKMKRPLLAEGFRIPQNHLVDRRLIAGAALFGIGWGIVGLCPGPAIAGVVFGYWQSWLFVAAMVGGMWLQRVYADRRDARPVRMAGGQ